MASTTQGHPPLSLSSHLRLDSVRRQIESFQPGTVLEFGCGLGGFGARFATMAEYTGVEPDATSFAVARSRIEPRGGRVLHGDYRVVPAGRTYDLVCAFEVLEHIEDDKGALDSWSRFLAPGGHLMVSVPAWPERFGAHDELAGHLRRYLPDEMRDLLVSIGLTEVHLQLLGWPIGFPLEALRHRLAVRRPTEITALTMEERTAASARFAHLQGGVGAALTRAVAVPFVYLQRARPGAGTCLLAFATAAS